MAESRRTVLGYYAYRATTSMGFYVPVSVVYLLDLDFGVAFVALTQAVFSFGLLAAEVPTGYLGDRLGRRATLAVGNACRIAALLGYVVAETAAAFLLIKVVMAVGWAFRSGTRDAWLYELLAAEGETEEFARIEGRGTTVLRTTSAVTAIAGSLLYAVDPGIPFLANAVLLSLCLPILYAFPTPDGENVDAEAVEEDVFTVREALHTLRLQVGRPGVRWLVAYATLVFLLLDLSRTFEQPSLEAVGVPVASFGFLYAGFKLVTAGAAATTGWFQDRLGAKGVFALVVPVLALAYASLALVPLMVVPVLFLYRSTRVVVRPVRNQYLNDRLDDVGRATVLSGVSMVLSLVGGFARIAGGQLAAVLGPVDFLAVAGVAIPAVAGVLWVAVSPVREGESDGGSAERAAAASD